MSKLCLPAKGSKLKPLPGMLHHEKEFILCHMQCAGGWYSAPGASSCTACPRGKYQTNASGGTEALSCTLVSEDACKLLLSCNVIWDGSLDFKYNEINCTVCTACKHIYDCVSSVF